jgi:hypothetical protein
MAPNAHNPAGAKSDSIQPGINTLTTVEKIECIETDGEVEIIDPPRALVDVDDEVKVIDPTCVANSDGRKRTEGKDINPPPKLS